VENRKKDKRKIRGFMMFSQQQIEFMKEVGLDFDFQNLSDEEYVQIEDVVGNIYTSELQAHEKETTETVLMCESILDRLE